MVTHNRSAAPTHWLTVALSRWTKPIRDEARKTVITLLAAVLTTGMGMVTSAMTGWGTSVSEHINPTEARVEGVVLQDGRPARSLVLLDGEREDETNSLGMYVFDDVRRGSHYLHIIQDGQLAYDVDFVVKAKQETVSLGTLDLAVAVPIPSGGGAPTGEPNPAYVPPDEGQPAADAAAVRALTIGGPALAAAGRVDAPSLLPALQSEDEDEETDTPECAMSPEFAGTPAADTRGEDDADEGDSGDEISIEVTIGEIPDDERKSGFEEIDRCAIVRVEAGPDLLSEIDRVTYYLDPSFDPSVVTRYDPEDNFELTFPLTGSFDVIARIYFADDTSVDLVAPIKS